MSSDSNRPADETGGENHLPDSISRLSLETVVETCLYSRDLPRMEQFYRDVLKLRVIAHETNRHVFFKVGPGNVLLIFNPDTTLHGHQLPSHGTTGPGHVAFGVKPDTLAAWRNHLLSRAVAIEKEHAWPKGGHSIYFRDPAGNSLELITPNVWGTDSGW